MASLFADENVRRGVVDRLRSLGHDVLTAHEADRANQAIADVDQLEFATAQQRAIPTNDRRDFHQLHAADSQHAGIITFTFDSDDAALADRIDREVRAVISLVGRLVKVTRGPVP